MTKITPSQHQQAYELGKEVFARRLGIGEAKERMRSSGINLNSATDLIYNTGHMLRGECYRRRMSLRTTADYFDWIGRDFGAARVLLAIAAAEQHIIYYEDHTQNNLPREKRHESQLALRSLVAKVRDKIELALGTFVSPEEIPVETPLMEGATKTIQVNIFERNPRARRECIAEFGAKCTVCGFDFAARYGAIGEGFIHVHHLREIASVGSAHIVNPKRISAPFVRTATRCSINARPRSRSMNSVRC